MDVIKCSSKRVMTPLPHGFFHVNYPSFCFAFPLPKCLNSVTIVVVVFFKLILHVLVFMFFLLQQI